MQLCRNLWLENSWTWSRHDTLIQKSVIWGPWDVQSGIHTYKLSLVFQRERCWIRGQRCRIRMQIWLDVTTSLQVWHWSKHMGKQEWKRIDTKGMARGSRLLIRWVAEQAHGRNDAIQNWDNTSTRRVSEIGWVKSCKHSSIVQNELWQEFSWCFQIGAGGVCELGMVAFP